jgi:Putative restriction endonuclease
VRLAGCLEQSDSKTRAGWTAGVGYEFGLTRNTSARRELMCFHLGNDGHNLARTPSDLQRSGFDLDDDTDLNPDILVHPTAIPAAKVRGGDALLVVEVADTSPRYDLNTKAPIYAAYGVREYWVINAITFLRWCTPEAVRQSL